MTRVFEFCLDCQQMHAHETICAVCRSADRKREIEVVPKVEEHEEHESVAIS